MKKPIEVIIICKQLIGILEEKYEIGFEKQNLDFYNEFLKLYKEFENITKFSPEMFEEGTSNYVKELYYLTVERSAKEIFLLIFTEFKNKLITFTNSFEVEKIFNMQKLLEIYINLQIINKLILKKL